MTQLLAQLQISTQVVWGTSDEAISAEVKRAETNGWQWDGRVNWRWEVGACVGCAVLISLASHRPADGNPRLTLTRA